VPRLKGVARRASLATGGIALAGIAGMVGTGLVINHNIKELNRYETAEEAEARLADFERKYLQYESLPRPVVTDVEFVIDIDPAAKRLKATGHYMLRNDSGQPITQLHIRQGDEGAKFTRLEIAGAKLASFDETHLYRIYRFATPLAPGATTRLDFATDIWRRGSANRGAATDIIDNGTFVNNFTFAPIIGMDRNQVLQDRTARRRQKLPAELRVAKLEDTRAQGRNYIGADWVNSKITLSTAADQVPIAPGDKISDVVRDGRRIAVCQSPAPILNFFSVQSARYAVAEEMAGGVRLSVYHDPKHVWTCPRCRRRSRPRSTTTSAISGPTSSAMRGSSSSRATIVSHRLSRAPCPIPKPSALPPTCAIPRRSITSPSSPRMKSATSTGRTRLSAATCKGRRCCPKPSPNIPR